MKTDEKREKSLLDVGQVEIPSGLKEGEVEVSRKSGGGSVLSRADRVGGIGIRTSRFLGVKGERERESVCGRMGERVSGRLADWQIGLEWQKWTKLELAKRGRSTLLPG